MDQVRLCLLALVFTAAGCCSTDPRLLESPDPEERRETLACIVEDAPELHGTAIAHAKRLMSLEESDAGVRGTAVRVLGFLKVSDAQPAITESLLAGPRQDAHPSVRVEAVLALRRFGGDDAKESLRLALREDTNMEVRLAAARELASFEDKGLETTTVLIASLDDTSMDVRESARETLRVLHHMDHGITASGWRLWLRGAADPNDETSVEDSLPNEEPALPDEEPALPAEEEFPDEPMEPFGEDEEEPVDDGLPDEETPPAEEPSAEEPPAEEPSIEEETPTPEDE